MTSPGAIRRVLVLGGLARSLLNFRGPLLQLLQSRGHDIIAAAPEDESSDEVAATLRSWGVRFVAVPLMRGGTNALGEWASLRGIRRLLLDVRPDVLIAYTVKPVVYGGIAARTVGGIQFFPMITGLGYAFTDGRGIKRKLLREVVTQLYRQGLKGASTVIFQNPDDQALFSDLGLIPGTARSVRVFGSGVDREAFPQQPLSEAPVFLMLARLVADKGVREYVEAARKVRTGYPEARFLLAGGLDPNPAAVSQAEVDTWVEEEIVEYLGPVQSVLPVLASCRYYVLPSYREGTPRSVLEAMSVGRPIITTDVPGCRETVEPGHNGVLVPPRDSDALAAAMIGLLGRSGDEILAMARASSELVQQKFDVHRVNRDILDATGL